MTLFIGSIHIFREAGSEAENPVMLYSVGKDSSVMLHLARKAFYPSPPPFALLHVDTRWKFQEMYLFRDQMARVSGLELLVQINPAAIALDINPFEHGSAMHTEITKTEGLKQALDLHKFDVVFGGARRDEEKSRAKERIFSLRSPTHRWDPKQQRPELWQLYNTRRRPGESVRVFPLSNWTELDIWQYIHQEDIPVVPLYFAKDRPVAFRFVRHLPASHTHDTMRQDEGRVLNKPRGRKPRRTPQCRFTLWRLHACGGAVMVRSNGALSPDGWIHAGNEAQRRHQRGLVRALM